MIWPRQYYQRAIPVYEAEVKRYPDKTLALAGLGWLLMRTGKAGEALALVQRAIHVASERGDRYDVDGLRWQTARMLGQLGKGDQAVAILGDLLSRPSAVPVTAASLKVDWVWDPIRNDPGFQALLKKYAKFKPAVTYAAPHASAATVAAASTPVSPSVK